ncbi:hypothetical protein ABII15_35940 [Streptomyces sp. HUAS MG91]|uniref:Transcriptional regulator n=1 Tax=Streptomyces tabacisoli TaxID=3156398 RepID=A0AAU8J3J4_9ACTN
MPETGNGRAYVAQTSAAVGRELRLAMLLADMLPVARTIRVSQREPECTWPSPYARAYDARGRLLPLNRAQCRTAARWVMRAHPEANWNEAHDLDLATGILQRAGEAYRTVAGRR